MWYRVFRYPNRLYSAREILALSLMPNDLISVNVQDNLFTFSEWYVFSDSYIQNLIAKDLGYTVGDDGVIHRIVSRSQTQSPKDMGYSIGDGVLHKTHSNQHSQYQPTTQTNGSSSNNSFESWWENIGGCFVWFIIGLLGYCFLNVILGK